MGPTDFVRLLEAVLIVSGRCLSHAARVRDLVLDCLGGTKAPRAVQSEAAQGCTDAITAVSEAAHACWIRLLNARHASPSRPPFSSSPLFKRGKRRAAPWHPSSGRLECLHQTIYIIPSSSF